MFSSLLDTFGSVENRCKANLAKKLFRFDIYRGLCSIIFICIEQKRPRINVYYIMCYSSNKQISIVISACINNNQ